MKPVTPDNIESIPGRKLSETDTFSFACRPELDCFNRCCRNLNLFLYPYDVLRLCQNLGISSGEFIDRYVDVVLRDGNHFPDVLLTMADNEEKTCPFLTKAGCSVYNDRPYLCRLFPVEQAMVMEDTAGRHGFIYIFRPPEFCHGPGRGDPMTPGQWIENQNAERYVRMTMQWAEIKALFVNNPWPGDGAYGPGAKMAFMAAYNLDAFGDFVFKSGFLKRYRVKKAIQKKLRASRAELLLLGFEWIKLFAWKIPGPRLRPM